MKTPEDATSCAVNQIMFTQPSYQLSGPFSTIQFKRSMFSADNRNCSENPF